MFSHANLKAKALYTGASHLGDPSAVSIDAEHVARCMLAGHSVPEVRICIDFIARRLLTRGIEFKKPSMKLAKTVEESMQEKYMQFASDVIRIGCTVGVVPYIITKSKTGIAYPVVLTSHIGNMTMTVGPKGDFTFAIENLDRNNASMRVFFEVFSHPTTTGSLTSTVASLLRQARITQAYSHAQNRYTNRVDHHRPPIFSTRLRDAATHHTHPSQIEYVQSLEVNSYIAGELNARPPLFLTTSSASFSERDIIDHTGITAEHEFHTQLMRNRIQMNVVRAQQMQMQYGSKADGQEPIILGSQRDRFTGLPVVDYSLYSSFNPDYVVLPANSTLHTHNVAVGPVGLEASRADLRAVVAAAFGLPISVMHGSIGGRVGASNAASTFSQDVLDNTMAFYKRALTRLCLRCYRIANDDQDPDVVVTFPSVEDVRVVEDLFSKNLIDYAYFRTYLAQEYNLPLEAISALDPRRPSSEPRRTDAAHPAASPPRRANLHPHLP